MTVVTADGKLVAAARGDVRPPDPVKVVPSDLGHFRAGLLAGPGQKIQVVDVPDAFTQLTDPTELAQQLTGHLARLNLL